LTRELGTQHVADGPEWVLLRRLASLPEPVGRRALRERLYRFGQEPLGAPGLSSLRTESVIAPGWSVPRLLGPAWHTGSQPYGGWRTWNTMRGHDNPAPAHFKVYLPVVVRDLPRLFPAVAGFLARHGRCFAFKYPVSAQNLGRPDRIVLYYRRPADRRADSTALADLLDGADMAYVPFTARDGDTGLHWGTDSRTPDGRMVSWRARVTARVALHLHRARRSRISVDETIRRVATGLRDDGVDPNTWCTVPTVRVNR
jgi:hypothetical protein